MRSKPACQYNPIKVFDKRKNEEGFTIIEVLMAICIFAIGMLAVATMQYSAIRVNSSANHLTERTNYAMDQMEKLMSRPYNDPTLQDNNADVGTATSFGPFNPIPSVRVTYTVDVNNPSTNSKRIVVQATQGGKMTQLVTIKSQL
jgi:type IV pilus modification protein PilV